MSSPINVDETKRAAFERKAVNLLMKIAATARRGRWIPFEELAREALDAVREAEVRRVQR